MSRDTYMAASLAMGMRESPASQYWRNTTRVDTLHHPSPAKFIPCTVTLTVVSESKRDKAIAYLRERKLYCLDRQQPRIPPQARPQTLLDKWMKERHK